MALDTTKDTPFSLPSLPYGLDALAPAISERTVDFHYNKHHRTYVEKLNELVSDTPLAHMSLEDVIKKTVGDKSKAAEYHNAAQVWNHNFYWNSLTPKPQQPSVALNAKIEQDFGGMEALKQALAKSGEKHFASGWSWLVLDEGKLAVIDMPDADSPLTRNLPCLLTIDVWEHAYYLDTQNQRPKYLKAVIGSLLNWKFASAEFDKIAP